MNPHTDEASFFLERAVLADLGVRAGFVWKKDSDGWQRLNASRRFQLHHPLSVVESGVRTQRRTTADTAEPEPAQSRRRDAAGQPGDETVPGYQAPTDARVLGNSATATAGR